MSNVQEFTTLNGYRVKDPVSREKVEKVHLADFVDCKAFAQVIGEKVGLDVSGFGVQGFAIGNDVLCVAFTHSNEGTGNLSKLITYNIKDGRVIAYLDNQSIGHGNGITYCTKDGLFYIACGGGHNGLNKIEVYDNMLNHIRSIGFDTKEHQNPWCLAWSEEKESFYVGVTGGKIVQYDYDFKPVNVYSMGEQTDPEITPQSIFIAGGYLFAIYNNLANTVGRYNKLDVYHLDTMKYYKKQLVMSHLELESCCEYNGELYLMFNSMNAGLICKGSLYEDINIGNYVPKFFFGGSRVATSSISDNYYVNTDYKDFFVENTPEKPFSRLWHVLNYIYTTTQVERISIYLSGDFSAYNINIKRLPCSLLIEGYTEEPPTIGGVFLQNIGVATLRNLNIVKRSDPQNALVTLKSVDYAWLDGVDFNGKGTENDGLFMVSSTAQLLNCNFNSKVIRNLIHCVENSYILFQDSNTFTGSGGFMVPDMCHLPYQFPIEKVVLDVDDVSVIKATKNFDITKIRRSGKYRIEGDDNTTSSINVPPIISTGGYTFTVNNVNHLITYDVKRYNNSQYIGIYNLSTNKISWKCCTPYVSSSTLNSEFVIAGSLTMDTPDMKYGFILGSVQFKEDVAINKDTLVATFDSTVLPYNTVGKTYILGVASTGKAYAFYLIDNKLYTWSAISEAGYIEITGTIKMADISFTV